MSANALIAEPLPENREQVAQPLRQGYISSLPPLPLILLGYEETWWSGEFPHRGEADLDP